MDKLQPVAWAMFKGKRFYDAICPEEHDREEGSYTVPLYTEPQYRELSDEEIKDLIVQHIQTWNSLDSIIDFARAILKKASEK